MTLHRASLQEPVAGRTVSRKWILETGCVQALADAVSSLRSIVRGDPHSPFCLDLTSATWEAHLRDHCQGHLFT